MTGHNKETHKRIRKSQKENLDSYHHPKEKIEQLDKINIKGEVLEVFGGQGNLTEYYKKFGNVTSMTKETFGNSFDSIYKLRGENKKYDFIDIDSYGYPDKFFPIVFELMKPEAYLVFTFPQVGINCLNGITQQHFSTFYSNPTPTIGDVVGKITDFGLREWILVSLVNVVKINRIYRFLFKCKRVKATEMCNVRNRPEKNKNDRTR